MPSLIVDTGPLVATFNRRDMFHSWAVERLQQYRGPLLTCEAVLSEAFFLLGSVHRGTAELLAVLDSGALEVAVSFRAEQTAISKLMRKYADVPMSLADACLVRLSELFPEHRLLTLDSDFRIYRRRRNAAVPVVMPDA
jgi:uncharacterized protein